MAIPYTWNADRIAPDTLQFGVKWRNYLTAGSGWSAIDLTPRQVSGDWVFDRSPYSLLVPPLSTGWLTFESTNRYDIHTKRVIEDSAVGVQKRYTGGIVVPGIPEEFGVRFLGCFPSLNAHRLIQVHEQKTRDLIVFTSEPPGNGDVDVPIEIDFGPLLLLESSGDGAPPREADFRGNREVKKGLTFTGGSSVRGVKIKQPFAWDSAGRRVPIKIVGRRAGSRFIGKKVIPRNLFDGAVYPVYADTTSTFYPDPHTETTSVDGYAQREVDSGSPESWATLCAGNGTVAGDTAGSITVRLSESVGGFYYLTRAILVFDTSSLPDGDEISAATLSLRGSGIKTDNGAQSIVISPGTSASNTAIAASDYQSNTSSTTYASMTITAWDESSGTMNVFTLDSAGRSAISKTGVTKYAVKFSGDASGTEPTTGDNQSARVTFITADLAEPTYTPKLVVTHAPPTYTATGALSKTVTTASGSATFAPGTKTATGALSKTVTTASGSATFVSPNRTASGAVTVSTVTAVGSATFAPGTKTAAAELRLSVEVSCSGSATFSPGTKIGAAELRLSVEVSCSGSATHVPPSFTASGTLSATATTASGSATFAPGTKTASGTLTKSATTASGSAAHVAPVYTASGAVSQGATTAAGSATFAPGTKTASGTLTKTQTTASGSATHTAPVYTGSGALAKSATTAEGSATFAPGTKTATGSLSKSVTTASGSATHTAPVYTASGALSRGSATAAGSAINTAPTYQGTGAFSKTATTASGAATFAPGTKTATGALVTSVRTASGTAVFSNPIWTGSGAFQVSNVLLSGTVETTPDNIREFDIDYVYRRGFTAGFIDFIRLREYRIDFRHVRQFSPTLES